MTSWVELSSGSALMRRPSSSPLMSGSDWSISAMSNGRPCPSAARSRVSASPPEAISALSTPQAAVCCCIGDPVAAFGSTISSRLPAMPTAAGIGAAWSCTALASGSSSSKVVPHRGRLEKAIGAAHQADQLRGRCSNPSPLPPYRRGTEGSA